MPECVLLRCTFECEREELEGMKQVLLPLGQPGAGPELVGASAFGAEPDERGERAG